MRLVLEGSHLSPLHRAMAVFTGDVSLGAPLAARPLLRAFSTATAAVRAAVARAHFRRHG